MATAKKLPSGSWRCLVYIGLDVNGKRQYKSFTAPTKKQAEYEASQYLMGYEKQTDSNRSVNDIVTLYINAKKDVLSQTTITAYLSIQKNLMSKISDTKVKALNSANVQSWIGDISLNHSPKTVKNAYGLLSAALDMFEPNMRLKVQLPQKEKKSLYVPTDSDIKKLIDYLKEYDKDMYIACNLAAFGTLRRSELCALTADDVIGNVLRINKAMVRATDGEWIIKQTKTTSSTRDIEMPQFVIDMLPKEGPLISITPSRVSDRFIKYLKRLNMRTFRFHDLRHYSASIMHAIGVPDVYIMQRGGWSSDATLKNIYRGAMDDYSKKFTDLTNSHFEEMQHEMQHKKKKP